VESDLKVLPDEKKISVLQYTLYDSFPYTIHRAAIQKLVPHVVGKAE